MSSRRRLWNVWKGKAREWKHQVFVLYWACRDPRVPWYAKLLAVCVVAYAFSPIDLIPDFIPVLGYVDDLILVPLGIALAVRLIPPEVLADCRRKVEEAGRGRKPKNWFAGGFILILWLLGAVWAGQWIFRSVLTHTTP